MYVNEGWIDWPATKTTKPYPQPWQQTLLEAAEALRMYGWCREVYGSTIEGFCLLGAIFYAGNECDRVPNIPPCEIQMTDAGQALSKHLNVKYIHHFNDQQLDNIADAIAILEQAANY